MLDQYFSDASHGERKIYDFQLDDETVNVYMTSHGHYRILQEKEIDCKELGEVIASIGSEEMKIHFREALKRFPLEKRKDEDWKTQINYVVSYYDVIHKIVIMAGIHPHLKRITIVTIIPRIDRVFSRNVFATYRVDNQKTKNQVIHYEIPRELRMKQIMFH